MRRPVSFPVRPSQVLARPRSALAIALRGRHLLLLDVAAIVVSFLLSLALRFDVPSPLFTEYLERFAWVLPILLLVRVGVFIRVGIYQRVWRYASIGELEAIVVAVVLSSAVAYALVYLAGAVWPRLAGFPRSIPFIDTLLLLAFIGGMRFSLLLFRIGRQGAGLTDGASRTLVVGAGSAGVNVAKQILSDGGLGLALVGFVDDTEAPGRRLLGLPVLGTLSDLQPLMRKHAIGTVLFALPTVDGATLRRLVRVAEREGARSLTVPSLSEVLAGQVTSALREVQVDDLLRRAPAKIDLESIRESFTGKTVLITGAGGSIGSELARQIVRYEPSRLYLLGRGENSVYDIQEALERFADTTELHPVILDVRDGDELSRLVRATSPDVVFHAAAHKHVPLMERYPEQAIATNVFGTLNLLAACEAAHVPSFVFVSTDKAVRPANVMGATKRVGELMVREAARRTGQRFVAVRFGNVLSSRGSVLPRFRRQLAEGGPLTVTHPEVRRYFMTLSEAVQLILQAAVLGRGGEIFVLDMGEPVRIEDLARDLIELHGMIPGKDVQIAYTGIRPGEKLSEELFLPDERPTRTRHESIWVAESDVAAAVDPATLEELRVAARSEDGVHMRATLRLLVPEYQLPAPLGADTLAKHP